MRVAAVIIFISLALEHVVGTDPLLRDTGLPQINFFLHNFLNIMPLSLLVMPAVKIMGISISLVVGTLNHHSRLYKTTVVPKSNFGGRYADVCVPIKRANVFGHSYPQLGIKKQKPFLRVSRVLLYLSSYNNYT